MKLFPGAARFVCHVFFLGSFKGHIGVNNCGNGACDRTLDNHHVCVNKNLAGHSQNKEWQQQLTVLDLLKKIKMFLKGLNVQHWVQVVMTVAQRCWGELVAFKVIFGGQAWLGLRTTKWRGRSFCKNKHNKLNLILVSLVSSPEDTHFWVDSCGVYQNHNLLPLHHKRSCQE